MAFLAIPHFSGETLPTPTPGVCVFPGATVPAMPMHLPSCWEVSWSLWIKLSPISCERLHLSVCGGGFLISLTALPVRHTGILVCPVVKQQGPSGRYKEIPLDATAHLLTLSLRAYSSVFTGHLHCLQKPCPTSYLGFLTLWRPVLAAQNEPCECWLVSARAFLSNKWTLRPAPTSQQRSALQVNAL